MTTMNLNKTLEMIICQWKDVKVVKEKGEESFKNVRKNVEIV